MANKSVKIYKNNPKSSLFTLNNTEFIMDFLV